jgi:hypothetical protein
MSSSESAAAVERTLWTLIFLETSLYGGFFVLYVISSLLLSQRRRYLQKEAKEGFGGFQVGRALDAGDKERLQTMRFWEISGAIMFVIITVVSRESILHEI